jgi:NAD(P)-dependent dehydrogenase (short-subunit alcohol dehydrogenase family)
VNHHSLFDLDERVALITGGGGLLGRQHAIALGTHGAKVYLADIRMDLLNSTLNDLKKYSIAAEALELDVTSQLDWENALHQILNTDERIDILVNNAGYTNQTTIDGFSESVEGFSIDAWDQILGVNLTGSFLGCKIIGSKMLEAGKGSIINIASLYGVVSPNHRIYKDTSISQPVAYSVSKGGVIALTKYLGSLWAERGVRVNCLTPGGVFDGHTEPFRSRFEKLNPIGKMLDKREIRGGVVFLASDASSHVVGHNLIIDGGWTVW